MKIWIDNDGCPGEVRDLIFRAGKRLQLSIKVVANRFMKLPSDCDGEMICVGQEFDAADDVIVEKVEDGDLVITADIPLADRVIKKGALTVTPRGQILDKENIGEQLALRNLRQELRSAGDIGGGPKPLNKEDHHRFAAALDKALARMRTRTPTRAQTVKP